MGRVRPSRPGEQRGITSSLEACPGLPWMAQLPMCGLRPAIHAKIPVVQSPQNSCSPFQASPNCLNVLSQGPGVLSRGQMSTQQQWHVSLSSLFARTVSVTD